MRSILLATATALALGIGGAALAAGGGGGASVDTPAAKPADANYTRAKALIEAKDYKGAMPLLQQVVAKDPKNADAYNLMGFATRKSGDANGSLQYYNQALGIDPKHLPEHKLDMGDEAKAWKTIWSAGHGVGATTAVQPARSICERLIAEYQAALQSE